MGHQHALPGGEQAVVAGCGCVMLTNPTGTIIGTAETCQSHGGSLKPGDCRACKAGPTFASPICQDCERPGTWRQTAQAHFCRLHWCEAHQAPFFASPDGLRACPGCAWASGKPFRIMAGGGMDWPTFARRFGCPVGDRR